MAINLKSAELIRTAEGKKGIYQLQQGAEMLLKDLTPQHTALAKQLKL